MNDKKQALLNMLEVMTGADLSEWENHDNPTLRAKELAQLAYIQGELRRSHLLRVYTDLGVPFNKFQHDFDVAFDAKQAYGKARCSTS